MASVPERMCVGCRVHTEKKSLIRVVRSPDGQPVLDTVGKSAGRGAYLCRSAECLKKAQKSRALERALGITIPEEIYNKLSEELNG